MLKIVRTAVSAAALGLLVLGAPAQAVVDLPAALAEGFEATYEIRREGVALGEYRLRLDTQDDHYALRSLAQPSGFIDWFVDREVRETAQGRFGPRWNIPLRYERLVVSDDKTERELVDLSGAQGQGTRDGKLSTFPLEPGLLDPSGLLLQLIRDRAAGELQAIYRGVDGRGEPRTYVTENAGTRRIELAGQDLRLEGIRWIKKGGERTLCVWLAPALGWLPAEIGYTEDGEDYRMRLETVAR